jgi:hypothetical protein
LFRAVGMGEFRRDEIRGEHIILDIFAVYESPLSWLAGLIRPRAPGRLGFLKLKSKSWIGSRRVSGLVAVPLEISTQTAWRSQPGAARHFGYQVNFRAS